MLRIVIGLWFAGCLWATVPAWGGEAARPDGAAGGAVEFEDKAGTVHAGEVTARSAAGFTLKAADGEAAFRWDALGPEVSFGILARLLPEADGQAWLDAAYLLETMPGGPPWADKALDKALAADPANLDVTRAAAALRVERVWFADAPAPAEPSNDPAPSAPPPRRTPKELGDHILAMAVDHQGQLWIGTEERGLWVENPAAPPDASPDVLDTERWRSFRAPALDPSIPQTLPGRNGPLPPATSMEIARRVADKPKYYETPVPEFQPGDFPEDTAPALAVDRLGRVWAGHLRHGVSVWNGESWKTYEPGDGPLGHRVFDMKTNPLDGDVWIATEVGLTRYRLDADQWTNYTMADGLTSHQVVAFAFDPNTGDCWTGYDAYGVGRAARDEHGEYPAWQTFRAPESFPAVGAQPNHPPDKTWPMPNTPTGDVLPSDFINDIAVDRDGAVWVATHTGLAWSRDKGVSWRYQRGRDWEERVKGLYQPPAPHWTCRPQDLWMPTDHVRNLVLDERGVLWAGFWRHPWKAVLTGSGLSVPLRESEALERIDYATVLLPTADGLLVGAYGQGVREIAFGLTANGVSALGVPPPGGAEASHGIETPKAESRDAESRPPHPSPAPVPSMEELAALLAELKAVPAEDGGARMVPLPDDWRTRGDWLGRYGRHWIALGATAAAPRRNYVWGAGEKPVEHRPSIGPHARPRDHVRQWTHWLYTTDPRSLEMPPTYYDSRVRKGLALPHETRRQSEWDDHSETYPPAWDGPHLYCSVRVPEGEYILSLYNFNKDGLDGNNRFRDYPIRIMDLPAGRAGTGGDGLDRRREIARGRFHDFRGGVWKRWRVQGPADLAVEIRRHGSWSTLLAAVALDAPEPLPEPYFDASAAGAAVAPPGGNAPDAAAASLAELDRLRRDAPAAWGRRAPLALEGIRRYLNARRDGETRSAPHRLSALRAAHALARFDEYEDAVRALGLTPARAVEKTLVWDGAAPTSSGLGRAIVLRALDGAGKLGE